MIRAITLAVLLALSGCSGAQDADEVGAVFDGVSPDAAIKMLGTEPFWDLTIAPQPGDAYQATITALGDPAQMDGRVFPVSRFAGNNGLGFSGELNGERVQIAITPADCSDGMSDRSYPFAATVALGDATLLGCAYTDVAPFSGPTAP